MKLHFTLLGWCLLVSVALANPTPSATDERPPNIVLIFIDDMGWADVAPFKPDDAGYETPNLERLASEGRTFTNFYVSDSVCSASRAALLTGCYHVRVNITGALFPKHNVGLNPEEVTIAEICKQEGYATACFGKWHLGHHQKFLPLQQGFDRYFGLPYSNDMWPHHPDDRAHHFPPLPLIEQNKVVNPDVTPEVQTTLTTQYTDRSVQFIKENKHRPFFLYLPYTMVHVPLFASEKFVGKSSRGLFGDVVMELDWSVGQILDAIDKNDLVDNTLVIFTTDNGPWLNYGDHGGSAGPLREGKGTSFEGGIRVPTVMRWPGKIPAHSKCHVPAMTIDILPTIAHLIGSELPNRTIDGKNIWPLMAGETGAESPHEAYYFYLERELQAIRMGRWKLHFPHDYRHSVPSKRGSGGKPGTVATAHIELSLFDMENDPGETTDVKDQHPNVVRRIRALADEMREDLGDRGNPGTGRRPVGRL